MWKSPPAPNCLTKDIFAPRGITTNQLIVWLISMFYLHSLYSIPGVFNRFNFFIVCLSWQQKLVQDKKAGFIVLDRLEGHQRQQGGGSNSVRQIEICYHMNQSAKTRLHPVLPAAVESSHASQLWQLEITGGGSQTQNGLAYVVRLVMGCLFSKDNREHDAKQGRSSYYYSRYMDVLFFVGNKKKNYLARAIAHESQSREDRLSNACAHESNHQGSKFNLGTRVRCRIARMAGRIYRRSWSNGRVVKWELVKWHQIEALINAPLKIQSSVSP